MSDLWNPHEEEPDPWLKPLWEDPDFIAEHGLNSWPVSTPPRAPRVEPVEPAAQAALEDVRAMSEAEAALGEFRGALRVVPREIAEGALRRVFLREASTFLHVVAEWIHPCDLALRAAGSTGSVLAATRSGNVRAALPVTLSGDWQHPHDESDAWAMMVDHHAELGMFLARRLTALAISSLDNARAFPAAEFLLAPLVGSDAPDPFEIGTWREEARHALKSGLAGGGAWSLWDAHRFGRDWARREIDTDGGSPAGLARLCLLLPVVCARRQGAACLLPWLGRLPQRHRRHGAPFELFSELPGRRVAWFVAVRDAARDAAATLEALLDVADKLRRVPSRRGAPVRDKASAYVFRHAVATVGGISRECRVSRQAALAALRELERLGVVREMTGRARFRAWSCVL